MSKKRNYYYINKDYNLCQGSDVDSENRVNTDSHSDQSQNIQSENVNKMDEHTETSNIDSASDSEVSLVQCDKANSDTISTTGVPTFNLLILLLENPL